MKSRTYETRFLLTNPVGYGSLSYSQKRERNQLMTFETYDECLEICTKRMAVMGYFPHEIEATAKNEWIIYENEMLYEMEANAT